MENIGKGIAEKKQRKSKYPHTVSSESFSEKIKDYPYSAVTQNVYNHCFRVLCSVLKTCDPTELCWHIELGDPTLKEINDSDLTASTKEQLIRSIPTLYKVLKEGSELPESQRDPYVKAMMANNARYLRSITKKKANERLPLYSDFMENVKGIFGEDSQEYLLISLYNELTCRDDFSQLLISPTYKASISRFNYCVVCLHKPVEVVLNVYKTAKKYGPIRVIFSNEVSRKIKTYINQHELQYGQYLFPQSSLSGFVSRILERCGLHGSISTLRRMMVSEFYNDPTKTENDFEELAKRMGHSVSVATMLYHRENEERDQNS